MKNTIVTGKWLNEKMGCEAEIYLDGKFDCNAEYTVYSDGSIEDSHGHQVAEDFVCDDILEQLNLI